jgi:hypothetical protein
MRTRRAVVGLCGLALAACNAQALPTKPEPETVGEQTSAITENPAVNVLTRAPKVIDRSKAIPVTPEQARKLDAMLVKLQAQRAKQQ